MRTKLFNNIPLLLILAVALLFAKLHINKRTGNKRDICFNITDDARGYYAWLPAIFIYHDLNFTFFDTVEVPDTTCGCTKAWPITDYRLLSEGGKFDKYYPGSAFMMLPFFIAAHAETFYFSSYPPNGYSYYYFRITALAAAFYYLIGMLFLLGVLKKLHLNTLQQTLTILLVSFGTNMIYYIIDAPLYSHIFSFALISAFLYYSFSLKERLSAKNIVALSFLTGMIFITRPVNVSVLLLLPFILGNDIKILWKRFLLRPELFACLLPALIMPAIMLALFRIATGHFMAYSYTGEAFYFLHPHFWQFLFHYDNGVFPYTPLLLLPFLFSYTWYRHENKTLILGTIITLLITIYIHSSWWYWTYGFAFGARTMVDLIPVFAIAIALSVKYTDLKRHFYVLPVYFLCCTFTLILYQQKSVNHYMGIYPITDYWVAIRAAFGVK